MIKRKSLSILSLIIAMMFLILSMPTVFAAEPTDFTIDPNLKTSLTIQKYEGQEGDTTKPLADVVFTYLKIADIEQINVPDVGYTVAYKLTEAAKTQLNLQDQSADYTVSEDAYYKATTIQDAVNSAGDLKSWIANNGGTEMESTNDLGSTQATNLDQGLYLVVETAYPSNVKQPSSPFVVSLPMPDGFDEDGNSDENQPSTKWIYDVTAKPKNQTEQGPVIDKNILEDEKLTKATDVQIGDQITFQIDADIPDNIKDLKYYQIVDTLSAGLTFNEITEVYGVDSDGKTTLLVEGETDGDGKNYIIREDEQEVTVAFYNKDLIEAFDQIRIVLKATLNEDAVIGDTGNPNHADLEYSNIATPGFDDDELPPIPPEDEIIKVPAKDPLVYTYAVEINKIAGDTAQKLAGAEFELYNSEGTKLNVSNDGSDYVIDADGNAVITSTASGDIVIKGLDAAKYIIKETKAPAGYNLLTSPIVVEIKSEKNYKVDAVNGSYIEIDTNKTYYKLVGEDYAELEYLQEQLVSHNGKTYLNVGIEAVYETNDNPSLAVTKYREIITAEAPTYTMDNGTVSFTVTNNKGFDLPNTGGAGVYFYIFGGLALIVVGFVFFLISRRKSAKSNSK